MKVIWVTFWVFFIEEGLEIIFTFFGGVCERHSIFLVPTLFKPFSMLYKIGYTSYLVKCSFIYIYRPVKWATSPKKQCEIRFFLNNMSTIRATNPNVWQLLKHFKCSSQWNSCRGSQGHLKVTQGHFKVIWGHFWWFSIFCLHIHGYTNLIVWLARNTAETI